MGFNLIVKPDAEDDLISSLDWYFNINQKLAQDFFEKINESFEKIKKNPQHYQKRYKEIRIVFVRKFPYGIYYITEGNTIYILAILHTKQNPKTAIKRNN